MNLSNLPATKIEKNGVWYECKPFVAAVKGGQAVIYPAPDGSEIKREPLARYTARARNNAFKGKNATEAEKAHWLIHCVQHTAEELGKTIPETASLLENSGLLAHALEHYGVYHTQGFEYMAEVLTDELKKKGVV